MQQAGFMIGDTNNHLIQRIMLLVRSQFYAPPLYQVDRRPKTAHGWILNDVDSGATIRMESHLQEHRPLME